jgi:hypothetical protein
MFAMLVFLLWRSRVLFFFYIRVDTILHVIEIFEIIFGLSVGISLMSRS